MTRYETMTDQELREEHDAHVGKYKELMRRGYNGDGWIVDGRAVDSAKEMNETIFLPIERELLRRLRKWEHGIILPAERPKEQKSKPSRGRPRETVTPPLRHSTPFASASPADLSAVNPQEAMRKAGRVQEQGPIGTGRNYRHSGEVSGPTDRRPVVYPADATNAPRGALRFQKEVPGGPSEMINGIRRGPRALGGR